MQALPYLCYMVFWQKLELIFSATKRKKLRICSGAGILKNLMQSAAAATTAIVVIAKQSVSSAAAEQEDKDKPDAAIVAAATVAV
jgi:hypothetical protein